MAGKSISKFSFNDFKELFFPVYRDFNSINTEIDTKFVSNNNWDLANDSQKYATVLSKIEEAKGFSDSSHSDKGTGIEANTNLDYFVLK